jgi:antitoxin (DNA-binding transcriptional repressor) of toxin-antitoxin stability system
MLPMTCTTVNLAEVRENLPEWIKRVVAGECVVITENGKCVAALTLPPAAPPTPEDIAAAQARAKEAVKAMVQHWIDSGDEIPAGSRLHELFDEET